MDKKRIEKLQTNLKMLRSRNPDGFHILSMTSCVSEERIEKIADGEEPDFSELVTLEAMQ